MIDFRNFIGRGTAAGSPLDIFAQLLFFVKVGSGQFVDLGPAQAVFKGEIDSVFFKGEMSLTLKLNPDGTAEVSINKSQASRATYTFSGQKLTVEAKYGEREQTITFEPGGKDNVETFLDVKGPNSISVHLAPGTQAAAVS